MAIFSYARKDGTQGTIEAPDPNAALKMMPADADPHSGVQLQGGTPASLPTLPAGGGAADPALPDAPTSPLLAFAHSLEGAVNIAKSKRNSSAVGLMKPFQGTAKASDFGTILGNLNAASDKTSGDLIKKATDIASPKITVHTNDQGVVSGVDDATGEVLWQTAAGVGNAQNNTGGASDILLHSGALTYLKTDYSDDASKLEQSRGEDGWVDPTVYQKLYDAWVANGGKIADFVKTYPPAQYVNPDNTWLPVYLRPKNSDNGGSPF